MTYGVAYIIKGYSLMINDYSHINYSYENEKYRLIVGNPRTYLIIKKSGIFFPLLLGVIYLPSIWLVFTISANLQRYEYTIDNNSITFCCSLYTNRSFMRLCAITVITSILNNVVDKHN